MQYEMLKRKVQVFFKLPDYVTVYMVKLIAVRIAKIIHIIRVYYILPHNSSCGNKIHSFMDS